MNRFRLRSHCCPEFVSLTAESAEEAVRKACSRFNLNYPALKPEFDESGIISLQRENGDIIYPGITCPCGFLTIRVGAAKYRCPNCRANIEVGTPNWFHLEGSARPRAIIR